MSEIGPVNRAAHLRERDPVEHIAPLLGPRVGLRMRRPIAAALRAPLTSTMPPSGAWLVTFTAGEEPRWNVEALRGMGVDVEAVRDLCLATLSHQWARKDHAAFVERTASASADNGMVSL